MVNKFRKFSFRPALVLALLAITSLSAFAVEAVEFRGVVKDYNYSEKTFTIHGENFKLSEKTVFYPDKGDFLSNRKMISDGGKAGGVAVENKWRKDKPAIVEELWLH